MAHDLDKPWDILQSFPHWTWLDFLKQTHTEKSEDFSESNTASANQNPPGCINSLNVFFIEYYISYTGANVGPNGNIRPNKHIERACFLFFPGKLLWNMGARMYSEVWDSWDCNSCLDLDLAKKNSEFTRPSSRRVIYICIKVLWLPM